MRSRTWGGTGEGESCLEGFRSQPGEWTLFVLLVSTSGGAPGPGPSVRTLCLQWTVTRSGVLPCFTLEEGRLDSKRRRKEDERRRNRSGQSPDSDLSQSHVLRVPLSADPTPATTVETLPRSPRRVGTADRFRSQGTHRYVGEGVSGVEDRSHTMSVTSSVSVRPGKGWCTRRGGRHCTVKDQSYLLEHQPPI